jgi:hypothetical protein
MVLSADSHKEARMPRRQRKIVPKPEDKPEHKVYELEKRYAVLQDAILDGKFFIRVERGEITKNEIRESTLAREVCRVYYAIRRLRAEIALRDVRQKEELLGLI